MSLSALIPTAACDLPRLTLLRRSIESALCQCVEGDEIVIAGDERDGRLPQVEKLCHELQPKEWIYNEERDKWYGIPCGPRVRYVGHDSGRMTWGHDQINTAMTHAKGDYLTFNDDDDVYLAGAFDAMRAAIARLQQTAPLMFRFRTHYGHTVWSEPGIVAEGHVGGHCAVFPNIPSLLGQWSERYEGDYDFIASTLHRWAAVGVGPVFVDRLIAVARPVVRYA